MATIKQCRTRAKKIGMTLVVLPKTDYWYQRGDRYKVAEKRAAGVGAGAYGERIYGRTVAEIAKIISSLAREYKKAELTRKLDGHRLKRGYTTVPRKRR